MAIEIIYRLNAILLVGICFFDTARQGCFIEKLIRPYYPDISHFIVKRT
jgi:hypothetical protein